MSKYHDFFNKVFIKSKSLDKRNIPVVGCTVEEIESLMAAQSVTDLPLAYRAYLEIMGKGGISNLYGMDPMQYNVVLRAKSSFLSEYNELTQIKSKPYPINTLFFGIT